MGSRSYLVNGRHLASLTCYVNHVGVRIYLRNAPGRIDKRDRLIYGRVGRILALLHDGREGSREVVGAERF